MRASDTVIGCLMCAGLALTPAAAHAQEGDGGQRSVNEGVFSTAQASRGKKAFSSSCAGCHTAGQFRGAPFQASWAGRPVRSFFDLLRTTMPSDDPGRLTRAEYAAVVAYVLQINGYPAGKNALPAQADALDRIRFDARPDTIVARSARAGEARE